MGLGNKKGVRLGKKGVGLVDNPARLSGEEPESWLMVTTLSFPLQYLPWWKEYSKNSPWAGLLWNWLNKCLP